MGINMSHTKHKSEVFQIKNENNFKNEKLDENKTDSGN